MVRYLIKVGMKCKCALACELNNEQLTIQRQVNGFRSETDKGDCRLVLCKDKHLNLTGYESSCLHYYCHTSYSEMLVYTLIQDYFATLHPRVPKKCLDSHDPLFDISIDKRIEHFMIPPTKVICTQ